VQRVFFSSSYVIPDVVPMTFPFPVPAVFVPEELEEHDVHARRKETR
jgi:hypothetical protein